MRPFAAIIVLALLVAACGGGDAEAGDGSSTSTTPGAEHPTGSDELVLRVSHEGGFAPVEFLVGDLPAFSLYGDGTVVVPGPQIAIYPPPALPNVQRISIPEDRIGALITAAVAAGVAGEDRRYGHDCVADAATTVFTLHAGGTTTTVSVYALGIDAPGGAPDPNCGVDAEAAEVRAALAAFAASLDAIVYDGSLEPPSEFIPSAMRVFVAEGAMTDPDLPQQPVEWPLQTPLDVFGEDTELGMRCGVVAGDELAALLEVASSANQLTPWTSGGADFRIVFRPLLPDESGC